MSEEIMESSGEMPSTQMSPAEMEIKRKKMEMIKNDLFIMAMNGKWDMVVDTYRRNPEAHKVKITRSGDTALHMAVSDGKEEIVKQLIYILISTGQEGIEALQISNKLGNTPLHLAVSMGTVAMCKWIAKVDPFLVGARNDESETPFFLAAFNGRKDVFRRLLLICGRDNGLLYSRRKNGETILHVAIAGDYFDLAFQIIHLFPDLVNFVNYDGFSPLHLLASKPSAFRSGSHLGRYSEIIYNCLWVDKPLQVDLILFEDTDPEYQANDRTCTSPFELFWNVVRATVRSRRSNGDLERGEGSEVTNGGWGDQPFPSNYVTCFEFVKLSYNLCKAVLFVLRLGSTQIRKIHDKKQKHKWSVQIMNELIERTSINEYGNTGGGLRPLSTTTLDAEDAIFWAIDQQNSHDFLQANQRNKSKEIEGKDTNGEGRDEPHEKAKNETTILISAKKDVTKISESIKEYFPVAILDKNPDNKNIMLLTVENKSQHDLLMGKGMQKGETPILIAAKNGITEIVEKILEFFPVAIYDVNTEKKNVVLLAVEHRQECIYQILRRNKNIHKDNVFQVVDNEGNSALHLAAKCGYYKPWLISGAALQMQWEIKWYKFVKESMPRNFFPRLNKERKTPKDIFAETHRDLIEEGREWLKKTSNSCSVVAVLVSTVASTIVFGGLKEDSGTLAPNNQTAYNVFAISALIALCFSVTTVITFHVAILTSRYQKRDFGTDLPTKLFVALTCLFISIASMLISFCAGHFFMLKDDLKYVAIPVFVVACLPVMFYAMVQFPLYSDLIWALVKKVPQRSYKAVHHTL